MYRILFVCRSPMAEYIMRDMLKKRGITDIETASAATSTEELGNHVHPGTVRVLNRLGIDCSDKRARQIAKSDCDKFDLLIGMDSENLRNMRRFWINSDSKIHLLGKYIENGGHEISDPWYTGDFEQTYRDIKAGCEGLINTIISLQKTDNDL